MVPAGTVRSAFRLAPALGAAVLTVFGAVGLLWASRHYPGLDGDWMSYRATLDRLFDGGPLYPGFQSEPYSLLDAARGRGYVYPPTSIPMLPLVTWVEPWRVLNLTVLLGGMWVATRSPLAVALTLAFPATWATWANGNAMPLIVGMYGIAYGTEARWWSVAASAIKPFAASLLILSWKRGEPIRWPLVVTGLMAAIALVGGYLPVVLNAESICHGQPILALHCYSSIGAWSVAGLLLLAAFLAPSDRLTFALLCLAPFALAPDWTWAYWLLPFLATMVLVTGLRSGNLNRPRQHQLIASSPCNRDVVT